MSSVITSAETVNASPAVKPGEMRLEVVVLAVSDVDRAKRFYEGLGWRLDADLVVDDGYRVVQLTPHGSGCSIIFGTGVTSARPGSCEGLQLSVYDIEEARTDLLARGVEVSAPFHDVTGIFHHAGTDGRVDGTAAGRPDYGSFASFSDPDGNGWLLQEIKTRLPGREERKLDTTYESASDLAEALRRAAAAHGRHEERTGEADPDWPDWYALYMVREHADQELPT
jgi:catechol 2,3-dioxygenase-like lactoylglutathione lyase family enzyme